MNLLDLLLVAAFVSAMFGGYRVGLVARVASWIGAVGGFLVALRVLPAVITKFGGQPVTRLFVTLGVLLLGSAIGGAIGESLGSAVRRIVPPPARALDRAGGAVAGVLGLVFGLWLLIPVLAEVPGSIARLTRGSIILAQVDTRLPRPPDTTQTLKRLVGDARFPDVFDTLRPAPDIGPPPASVPIPDAVVRRAIASNVNVEADGCGGRHEGSGFVVSDGVVVTNAHVVAGAQRIRLRRPDNRLITARIVTFDDNRDLAVLSAPGLGLPSLDIGNGRVGAEGAVIGHPGGQDQVRVAPAVVRRDEPAIGRDIYGQDQTRREVLFLAAELLPGDSGAALVGADGKVMGVAFAIAPDKPGIAYALDDSELRGVLAEPRQAGAGGPCI